MKKKKRPFLLTAVILTVLILVFNLAGMNRSFCDFYTDNIYHFIADGLGFITAPIPFPLGETLMYAGAVTVIVFVLSLILLIFFHRKKGYRRFVFHYARFFVMTALVVVTLYTFNWTVPVRGTLLGQNATLDVEFTPEEMTALRNYIVEQLNRTAEEVERDESGSIIFPDQRELNESAARGLQSLSDEFPRLAGYYPPIKDAICSDVLDWMKIGGYTYPFTMETTQNKFCIRLYLPVLYAHESLHHKGYYKESEAVFLSYIGCISSDSPIVRYSGWLWMYMDVNAKMPVAEDAPMPSALVQRDLKEDYADEAARYAAESHPLECFKPEAKKAGKKGWKTQGKFIKKYDYSGGVNLILQYYKGKIY